MFDLSQPFFVLEMLIFGSVFLMHLMKKNRPLVWLYAAQSAVVVFLLYGSSLASFSVLLFVGALATFAVKIIFAPYFFQRLIARHQLTFSASTYLNLPITLVVIAALTALAYAPTFAPFAALAPAEGSALLLAFATMLLALFLIVNRKGAISQMLGILSLENAIVSFAFLAGIEQTVPVELIILFDIAVWVAIASVFASMVYTRFGTLDVTSLAHLTEE